MLKLTEFKEIIHILLDDGLSYKQVASAFNLSPGIIRKIDGRYHFKGLKKYGYRLQKVKAKKTSLDSKDSVSSKYKIDKNKFIKMWKKGIPYEVMANYFKVSIQYLYYFKSKFCRDIVRSQQCICGIVFSTKIFNKRVCDSCHVEKVLDYFEQRQLLYQMHRGTELIEKRRIKQEEREAYLDRKKQRKIRFNRGDEDWMDL